MKEITNRDFDWDPGVNPMLVIEIDAINSEPLQAAFASLPHIMRIAARVASSSADVAAWLQRGERGR
ncbi:hypothetical protein FNV43_RR12879 [Rhamnella rubrinervis]|uniref:Uncharacterized protein n=1 Tax=Rhamnella rubrinervis TaxID=2594499 RepID=A0A8K0MEI2_9ROSA|nr:hypothetical protein FNV43_RR12879 [Rhamnella rubrinervis]